MSQFVSEVLEDVPWNSEDVALEISEEAFLSAPACCSEAYEMDEWESLEHSLKTLGTPRELEEVAEDIQTNLWLSVIYRRQGSMQLAKECAQAAFDLWRAYFDVLDACFGKTLRNKVVRHAVNFKCSGATRELLQ